MRFDAGIVIQFVVLVAGAAIAAWPLSGTWLAG
jgi:hypothetical protein